MDVDDLDKLSDEVIEKLKEEKADETEIDVAALHQFEQQLNEIAPLITTEECDKNQNALQDLIELQFRDAQIFN